MIRGYVDHATTPGGAVAYIGNLATWDHIFKDTLYATQEIFGDAGKHARAAIGVAELPLGASVELEMIVEVQA